MFQNIDYTTSTEYVVFTLANGTELKLPTWYAFEELRTQCNEMNTNITSLQGIVTALQDGDYITSVTPLMEEGKDVGYTISFKKNPAIVIYHGKDGEKGEQGEPGTSGGSGETGKTPVIGVRQDTDGVYYWTLDGEWLTGENGEKVRAQGADGAQGTPGQAGVTPQLKIEADGYWYVSYDNGTEWEKLGKATGDAGESIFESVTEDEDYVYIKLKGETDAIAVPKYKPLSIAFSETEDIRVLPNKTYSISYTLTGSDEKTVVKALAQDGFRAEVKETDAASGVIEVTTPATILSSEVLVFISDGKEHTVMASINFVEGVIVIATKSYTVEHTGGRVNVELSTNIDYTVEIPEEAQGWISLATQQSRVVMREETVSFEVAANTSTQMRYATIKLVDNLGVTSETILITQRGGSSQTVHVTTAGTLEQLISTEDAQIIEELTLTGTLNTFDYDFMRTMPNLKSVDLSGLSDTRIPASAFSGAKVSTVILPLNLETIGSRAFYGSAITSIYIPETVKSIEEYAFAQTESLTGNVEIPDATTSIGDNAFQNSAFNGTLTLGSGLKTIGQYAFAGCGNITGDLIIPDAVETMDISAFQEAGFSGNLQIGTGLTEIPANAFSSCKFTGTLTIGENVVTIGNSAFSKCAGLTGNLIIPGNVESIESKSFIDCSGFEGNLIIGDKVSTIKSSAFENCSGFKGYLTIGSGVKSIGNRAFVSYRVESRTANQYHVYSCYCYDKLNFTRIYCKAVTPPSISTETFGCREPGNIYDRNSIILYAVDGTYPEHLIVPIGTEGTYQAESYWQDFDLIEGGEF